MMDLSSFYFNSTRIEGMLNVDDAAQLFRNGSEKRCTRGYTIFEEGSYPKGVFVVKRGRVKIFHRSSTGSEQIIAIHGPGDIFGYRSILSGERYPVSAKTLEPASVVFIPKRDFQKVLGKSAAFSNLLLKYLSHEFTVSVNTISLIARTTVKERLLLNILVLSEHYREKSKWPIHITLPKADLASLVGTSSETLARMLKVLKQDKLIVSRGRSMYINGPEQLRRIQKEVALFI